MQSSVSSRFQFRALVAHRENPPGTSGSKAARPWRSARAQGPVAACSMNLLGDGARSEGRCAGRQALAYVDAVLPACGTSRMPLISALARGALCRCFPVLDQHPVEAIRRSARLPSPLGGRIKDVSGQGVSLRCWDSRKRTAHRWHPLFLAGRGWPTAEPLEWLAGLQPDDQKRQLSWCWCEQVRAGAPSGLPPGLPSSAGARPGGEPRGALGPATGPVCPWSRPGKPGGGQGRWRFGINEQAQLTMPVKNLVSGPSNETDQPRIGPLGTGACRAGTMRSAAPCRRPSISLVCLVRSWSFGLLSPGPSPTTGCPALVGTDLSG